MNLTTYQTAVMTLNKNLKKVLSVAAVVASLGASYALAVGFTPFYLPCIFNLTTGYLCPGCGITRMFMAIFRMDFAAACGYNAGVFVALMPMTVFLASWAVTYVRSGSAALNKWQKAFAWAMAAYLILWSIVRNLY